MPLNLGSVLLMVGADTTQLVRGLDEADQAAQRTSLKIGAAFGAIGASAVALLTTSIMTAAQTETLGVALQQVGKNAGYTTEQLNSYVEAIKAKGITTQEATIATMKFITSELDAAKAVDLARVAQDLAVKAGINSSEAFGRLTYAISTMNPQLLQSFEIIANSEEVMKNTGRELGYFTESVDKSGNTVGQWSQQMTIAERKQGMMNFILAEGEKVAGSYVAAMTTVGKQLGSLRRITEEAANTLGTQFLPIVAAAVKIYSKLIESFTKAPKAVQTFISIMVAAAAVIGTVAGAIHLLGPMLAGLGILIGPITAVSVAIGALAAAWVMNFGGIQEKTQVVIDFIVGKFQQLQAFVGPIIADIAGALSILFGLFSRVPAAPKALSGANVAGDPKAATAAAKVMLDGAEAVNKENLKGATDVGKKVAAVSSAQNKAAQDFVSTLNAGLDSAIDKARKLLPDPTTLAMDDPNGPFRDIYRALDVAKLGAASPWAEGLGLTQEAAQQIAKDFKAGIFSEGVKSLIDKTMLVDMVKNSGISEAAKASKDAFILELAKAAGVGVGAVEAILNPAAAGGSPATVSAASATAAATTAIAATQKAIDTAQGVELSVAIPPDTGPITTWATTVVATINPVLGVISSTINSLKYLTQWFKLGSADALQNFENSLFMLGVRMGKSQEAATAWAKHVSGELKKGLPGVTILLAEWIGEWETYIIANKEDWALKLKTAFAGVWSKIFGTENTAPEGEPASAGSIGIAEELFNTIYNGIVTGVATWGPKLATAFQGVWGYLFGSGETTTIFPGEETGVTTGPSVGVAEQLFNSLVTGVKNGAAEWGPKLKNAFDSVWGYLFGSAETTTTTYFPGEESGVTTTTTAGPIGAVEKIWNDIVTYINTNAPLWGAQITAAVGPAWQGVVNWWDINSEAEAARLGVKLSELITAATVALPTAAPEAAGNIGTFVGATIGATLGEVETIVGVGKMIANFIAAAVGAGDTEENRVPLVEVINNMFKKALLGFVHGLEAAAPASMKGWAHNLVVWMEADIAALDVQDKLKAAGGKIADPIGEGIAGAFKEPGAGVGVTNPGMPGMITPGKIAGIITDSVTKSIDTAALGVAGAKAGGDLVTGVGSGMDAEKKDLTKTSDKFWSAFLNGVGDALGVQSPSTKTATMGEDIVKGFINGLADTRQDAIDKMVEFGKDLIQGAKVGIDSKVGEICKAAEAAVTAAIKAAREAAEAASPSQKMAELGGDLMSGLTVGIAAAAPSSTGPIVALSDLVKELVRAVKNGMKNANLELLKNQAKVLSGIVEALLATINAFYTIVELPTDVDLARVGDTFVEIMTIMGNAAIALHNNPELLAVSASKFTEFFHDLRDVISPFFDVLDFWLQLAETVDLRAKPIDFSAVLATLLSALTDLALNMQALRNDARLVSINEDLATFAQTIGGLIAPFAAMLEFWQRLDALWSYAPPNDRLKASASNLIAGLGDLATLLNQLRQTLTINQLPLITDTLVYFGQRLASLLAPFSAMLDFWQKFDALWSYKPPYLRLLVLTADMASSLADLARLLDKLRLEADAGGLPAITDTLVNFGQRLASLLAPFSAMLDFWQKFDALWSYKPTYVRLLVLAAEMIDSLGQLARLLDKLRLEADAGGLPAITDTLAIFGQRLAALLAPFSAMLDFWQKFESLWTYAPPYLRLIVLAANMASSLGNLGAILEQLRQAMTSGYLPEIHDELIVFGQRLTALLAPFSAMLDFWQKFESLWTYAPPYLRLIVLAANMTSSLADLGAILEQLRQAMTWGYLGAITAETVVFSQRLTALLAPFNAMLDFWQKFDALWTYAPPYLRLIVLAANMASSLADLGAILEQLRQAMTSGALPEITAETVVFSQRLTALLAPFNAMLDFWQKYEDQALHQPDAAAFAAASEAQISNYTTLLNVLDRALQPESDLLTKLTPQLSALVAKLNALLTPFSAMLDFWKRLADQTQYQPDENTIQTALSQIMRSYQLLVAELTTYTTTTPINISRAVSSLATQLGGLVAPFSAMLDFWQKMSTAADIPLDTTLTSTLTIILNQFDLVASALQSWLNDPAHAQLDFTTMTAFGQAMSTAFTGLISALDLFKGLQSFIPVLTTRIDSFLAAVTYAFDAILVYAKGPGIVDGSAAVKAFAEATGSIFSALGTALGVLTTLSDLSIAADPNDPLSPTEIFKRKIAWIIERLNETMTAFKVWVIQRVGTDWLGTAKTFLDAVSSVMSVLNSALSLFSAIEDNGLPTTTHLQAFLEMVLATFDVITLGLLGAGMNAGSALTAGLTDSLLAGTPAVLGAMTTLNSALGSSLNSDGSLTMTKHIIVDFTGTANGTVPLTPQQFESLKSQLSYAIQLGA